MLICLRRYNRRLKSKMASSRVLSYIPRLGQLVCLFILGVLVGYYVLHDRSLTDRDITKRHPHFKCVETSPEDDNIRELGVALDDLDSFDNRPEVGFNAHVQMIQERRNQTWGLDNSIKNKDISSAVLLSPNLVTNVVHYLWCESKIFEFQHYLSVLSVVTHINPERIIFHYVQYPRYDTQYYNTWFEDMKKEFFYIDILDRSSVPDICKTPQKKMEYIKGVLKVHGGIYVHFNTIFLNFPMQFRRNLITDGLTNEVDGFLVAKRAVPFDKSTKTEHRQCLPPQDYRASNPGTSCVIKRGPYHPKDAWDQSDDFSKEVNMLLYGQNTRPRPQPSDKNLVPNIGHMFWSGESQVDFLFYLGCLSYLYILKVDRLYIHGDAEPSGKYWELAKQERKLTFVKITRPSLIFRKKVNAITHMSDVFRADVLLRYGGIYSDTDAVWINPIPPELRRYDVVASYDWPIMYSNYPDYINFGAVLSKPGAPFWHYYLHGFKDFKDDFFGYNGLLKPYKIFERHPDLVHIYDKLQVMCWELLCHPTWYPDFRKKEENHKNHPDFNWRAAHLFHWTSPTPEELTNETSLKNSKDTMWAQIGKHILKAAGKL